MQPARAKYERSQPRRTERVGIADHHVQVVVVGQQSGRWQRALLHQIVMRGVVVGRRAQEPLRFHRLSPVKPERSDVIPEWHTRVLRHLNGADGGNEAAGYQAGQRIELVRHGRAIRNAGVFVNVFEGRKHPDLIALERTSQGEHVILPREGLLRIGSRIFNGKARIESGRALVESGVAMPFIAAPPRRDHDRTRRGSSGIGILVSRAHGKFLDGLRREILEKSADEVVGIIAAIHGKLIVQAGTASGSNGGDASFRGI